MRLDLTGRNGIVCGGSRAIDRAIALTFTETHMMEITMSKQPGGRA